MPEPEPTWPASFVADLAGVRRDVIRQWIHFGHLPTDRGTVAGRAQEYTRADLVRIFMILELLRDGVPLRFARDVLDQSKHVIREAIHRPSRFCWATLAIEALEGHDVAAMQGGNDLESLKRETARLSGSGAASYTVIQISSIVRRLRARLGQEWEGL